MMIMRVRGARDNEGRLASSAACAWIAPRYPHRPGILDGDHDPGRGTRRRGNCRYRGSLLFQHAPGPFTGPGSSKPPGASRPPRSQEVQAGADYREPAAVQAERDRSAVIGPASSARQLRPIRQARPARGRPARYRAHRAQYRARLHRPAEPAGGFRASGHRAPGPSRRSPGRRAGRDGTGREDRRSALSGARSGRCRRASPGAAAGGLAQGSGCRPGTVAGRGVRRSFRRAVLGRPGGRQAAGDDRTPRPAGRRSQEAASRGWQAAGPAAS